MKNSIKKLSLLLSTMLLVFMSMTTLTSCKDDDDDDDDSSLTEKLVGTWRAYDEEEGDYFTITFNKNGSGYCSYSADNETDRFDDYKVQDGRLYIKWEGDDYFEEESYIEFKDNNTFIMRDEYEDGVYTQTFTRVR